MTEGGNYRGLQPLWYDQDDDPEYEGDGSTAFMYLETRLTDAYNAGFRRIILNLPAGMVRGQNMASAQWWSMPYWKRCEFTCLLTNWLDSKPDTQFEIYGAYQNNDSGSLCMQSNDYATPTKVRGSGCTSDAQPTEGWMHYPCAGASIAYSPSAFSQSDVCEFHDNIKPWQYLGITRYWLDWSTTHWSTFAEFPYCPLYAPGQDEHHYLGAEAFPVIDDGQAPYPLDEAKIVHVPAIAFHGSLSVSDINKQWDVASMADDTELNVVVEHAGPNAGYFNVQTMAGVLAWTQRGFVVVAQGPDYAEIEAINANQLTEYIKRVYDFGSIDGRDFNGDGLINATDVSDYSAAYALYGGKTTGCNWAHGDMNQDNDVDSSDQILYNHRRMSLFPVTINLGTAEPNDALTK